MKALRVTLLLLLLLPLRGMAETVPYTMRPYVIKGVTYYPLSSVDGSYEETGVASWYGKDFHKKKTASGEEYNMFSLSAAHKTLPLPTYIRVTNLENNKSAVVRVNDRGPFSKGRILDLSYAAAKELDVVSSGTAKVRITVLSQAKNRLRTEGKDVDINAGQYGVQIGSFAQKQNAERLAGKVRDALVVKAEVDGKLFYRVQVVGFNTRQKALSAAEELDGEYDGAFVIAK